MSEAFERFFEKIFELFKNNIKEGVPALHIPPFDPLNLPGPFDKSINESFFLSAKAEFSDVDVHGLATFSVPKLDFDHKQLTLSATTTTAAIKSNGQYTLDGSVIVPAPVPIPLVGAGGFTLDVDSITVTITLKFSALDIIELKPEVKDVDVKFGETEVHLDNLEGGGVQGWLFNKIVNLFSKSIAHSLQGTIAEEMKNHLQKFIDDERRKILELGSDPLSDALAVLTT